MQMQNQKDAALHVVLGGGQIGDRVANLLAERGHAVRVVQRTRRSEQRPNVSRVAGDIRDRAFAQEATRGASVVYDCMNPQYHQWPELLLPMASSAIDGAARAGASLIALDCLYMYGVPQGEMREDSPRNPCSKKGELRLQLEKLRMAADQRGDVRVAIGRAADFFGPDVPLSVFAPRFWQRLFAGHPVECPGDPDMLHSYSYADDVARGLSILGQQPSALGEIWHLPVAPAETSRSLFTRIANALDTTVQVRGVPTWLLKTAGLFSPFMREAAEMNYQWQVPYVLDDSRFRQAFETTATPIEQAITETTRWARATYARAAA